MLIAILLLFNAIMFLLDYFSKTFFIEIESPSITIVPIPKSLKKLQGCKQQTSFNFIIAILKRTTKFFVFNINPVSGDIK